jgi:hypothetical protein
VSGESFTRDGVHFAAVSADRQRFAVSAYLRGVGDPSNLEEERIVVCDAETGTPIASVPSEPLLATRDAVLDGMIAGWVTTGTRAKTTLRLFRLLLLVFLQRFVYSAFCEWGHDCIARLVWVQAIIAEFFFQEAVVVNHGGKIIEVDVTVLRGVALNPRI